MFLAEFYLQLHRRFETRRTRAEYSFLASGVSTQMLETYRPRIVLILLVKCSASVAFNNVHNFLSIFLSMYCGDNNLLTLTTTESMCINARG